jgi:predicted AlkP superfamily phosphohydrolase/phosphomutase
MGEHTNAAFITELERNLNAKASEGVRFIVRAREPDEPTESAESSTATHVVQCVRFGVVSQIFMEIIFYSMEENNTIYVKVLFDAYSGMDDYIGYHSKPFSDIVKELRHILQFKLDIAYMVECIVKNRIKDALKPT